jgi:hypothetical protein
LRETRNSLENYAPDGSLTTNDGPPAVGRAAIAEAARAFMVAFPDMQVLMDNLLVQGENAEYRWTLVGTNTGPGGWYGPSRQDQRFRRMDDRRRWPAACSAGVVDASR